MTADAPDLVTLLYRADWTQLSLAADVSITIDRDLAKLQAETDSGQESEPTGDAWEVATDLQGTEVTRSTLLVAPGRRYRQQGDGFTRGRDGGRSWRVSDDDPGTTVAELPFTKWPLDRLLRPSWLLTGFTLETREPVTTAGRAALRVVATPRRGVRAARGPARPAAGPANPTDLFEVVVDTELGILLRYAEMADGRPVRVTELTSVSLNPAGADDATQFQPPSGWDGVTEEIEPPPPWASWGSTKFTELLTGGISALVKNSSPPDPFRQATREGPETEMPEAEPFAPDAAVVSDEIVHLLYGSESRWAPGIAATEHQWRDTAAQFLGVPDYIRRVGSTKAGGISGLTRVYEVLGQKVPDMVLHMVSQLRVGGPDRYRIVSIGGTNVCDGEQYWQVFADNVMVGAAEPMPGETADLFDSSWLLAARLTGGTETTIDGRRGYRLAVASDDALQWRPVIPDEVVVDAEFGCVLRLIARTGTGSDSRVVVWQELRDVTSYAAPAEDFQPDIPDGAHVGKRGDPTAITSIFAREMVKGARSKVEGLLGFFRGD